MSKIDFSSINDNHFQNALLSNTNLSHILLENSHDYIYFKDRQSRFIKVNEKAAWALGATYTDEVIGKSEIDYFPDIGDQIGKQEQIIMETGKPQINIPVQVTFADGTKHWLSVTKTPFKDKNGNIVGIIVISRDITTEKNIDEIRKKDGEQFRNVAYETPIMIHSINAKGELVFVNREWVETLGYTEDEVLGRKSIDYLTKESCELARKLLPKFYREGQIRDIPYQMVKKNGEIIDVLLSATAIRNHKGDFISSIAVIQNITEKKKLEISYHQLFEMVNNGVAVYDAVEDGKNFVFRDFNRAAEKIDGVKREEIIGKKVTEVFPGVSNFGLINVLKRVWKTGQTEFFPEAMYNDDRISCEWRENWVYKLSTGEIVAVYDDVTGRKRKEESLTETERIGRIGNAEWDIKKDKIIWSDMMYELYERDHALGPPSNDEIIRLYHPEDATLLEEAVNNAVENAEPYKIDLKVNLPSGKLAYHYMIGEPIKDKIGNVVRIKSIVQDITKRKLVEIELQQSEKQLKDAERIGRIGHGIRNLKENTFSWSDEMYKLYEMDPALGQPSFDEILSFIQPRDSKLLVKVVKNLIETGESYEIDIEAKLPTGKRKYFNVIGEPVLDINGDIHSIKGTIQDITKRKLVEIELQKSKQRLKLLFDNAPDGIYLMDMKGKIVDGNGAAERMCGYNKDELIGKNFIESKLISKKQLSSALKIIEENRLGKPSDPVELTLITKKGTTVPIEIHTYPVNIENKLYILGIARDITERKESENKIKESEERFRSLAENALDAILIADDTENYIYANKAASDLTGYSKQELNKHRIFCFIPCSKKANADLTWEEFIKKEKQSGECEILCKNGTTKIVEYRAVANFTKGLHLFVLRDVTNRKMAEFAMKRNEEKFKTIFNSSTDIYCIQSIPGLEILDVNDEACRRFGYSRREFKKFSIDDLNERLGFSIRTDEDQQKVQKVFDGGVLSFERLLKTKTGDNIWHLITLKTIWLDGKKQLLTQAKDITELKKGQEKIKDSEKKYRDLFDNALVGITVHDVKGKIIAANHTAEKIFGLPLEDLTKKDLDFWNGKILRPNGEQMRKSNFPISIVSKSKKSSEGIIIGLQMKKSMNIRWFVQSARPIVNEKGEIATIVSSLIDITDRKNQEETVRKQSILLAESEKLAHIGGWEWNLIENSFDASDEWYRIHGYEKSEISLNNLLILIHPDDLSYIQKSFKDAIDEGKPITIEYRIIRQSDGKERIVNSSATIIKGADGKPLKIYGITQDITKQRETERRHDKIIRATDVNVNMITFSKDPVYTYTNPVKSVGQYGYKNQELVGQRCFDYIHPDDRKKLKAVLKKYLKLKEQKKLDGKESNIKENLEWRFKDKQGNWHYANSTVNLLGDELLVVSIDVTEQKLIEKALRESEREKKLILNSVSETVCFIDPDLRVKWMNPAGINAMNKEEIIGKHCYTLWFDKDKPCDDCPVKQSIETGAICTGHIQSPDGRYWSLTATPVNNQHDTIIGAVETAVDITKIRTYQLELEQHQRLLETINKELTRKVEERTKEVEMLLKQKDEFIHQLGHDLKNPLGPLLNLLPILEKNERNPKQKEIFQVINRNVTYMRNLVTKTIQLAQLKSSNTLLHFETYDLNDQVNDILETNKMMFENKQITVENNIPKDVLIHADKLKIHEVFNNILNNAVKYIDKDFGTIIIDQERKDDSIIISIKDEGIGMTKEQLKKIFDEFYKADLSRHDFDSSGLGMPISKRIIEMHGGNIWAESLGIGKGSTILFTLPSHRDDISYKKPNTVI